MATDFVGTNTEKIDKLIRALVELQTTVRLSLTVVWVGIPLAVGLNAFLVSQTIGNTSRIERLGERIEVVERRLEKLTERVAAVEPKVDAIERKVDALERQMAKTNERLDSLDRKLDRLIDRHDPLGKK